MSKVLFESPKSMESFAPGPSLLVRSQISTISNACFCLTIFFVATSGNVTWAVRDSRGNEFSKGSTPVTPFGSFHLSFPIPDNANLGYAYITFTYDSKSHGHSFQIQEVRNFLSNSQFCFNRLTLFRLVPSS